LVKSKVNKIAGNVAERFMLLLKKVKQY